MPIDPRIAMGYQAPQIESPLNAYAKFAQIQGAQQANELARMQSQEYARGLQEQEGLRNYLAGNPDLSSSESQSNVMRFGKSGLGILESAAKLRKEQTESQAKSEDLVGKVGDRFKNAIDAAASPAELAAIHSAMFKDKVVGPVLASMGRTPETGMAQIGNIKTPEEFRHIQMMMSQGTSKYLQSVKPQVMAQGNRLVSIDPVSGQVKPVEGSEYTPPPTSYQQGQQDIARQRLGIEQAGLEMARQEAARKAEPPTQKPLTQQQEIKLRGDVGKDYKSASTTISQMDDLLESINAVKTAPGLEASTGYLGKLPSMPGGQAAQAETRLANLKGKVTALGKAVASMGGSIGSIATKEWEILANQIANIDPVKGKGPLLEQIDLIENQAIGAINRIKDGYEKTRGEDFERFPQFQNLPESRVLKAKNSQQPAAPGRPSNVDQAVWNVMTPEERALFANPNP
jgi:hypothetical protein